MTDQQDLKARLLEECDRKESIPTRVPTMNPRTRFVQSDRVRDLLREAAAQLGRVEYFASELDSAIRSPDVTVPQWTRLAGMANELRAIISSASSPQLPAGVPDGFVLVPREPTDAMCDSIEYGAARLICETRREDRMYFLRKAIAAAPQPDSAAPGGDVERMARELLAAEYDRYGCTSWANVIRDSTEVVGDEGDQDAICATRAIIAALSAPKQVGEPARYFADGPQGQFFADDLKLARELVNLYDKQDDWTITDLQNPTGPSTPQAAPVPVEGDGPDKLRSVVSAIEDEVAAGRHTAASVFTKMRQLIATQPPSQPAADLSSALEKATDRIVASRAERMAVELEQFRPAVAFFKERASQLPLCDASRERFIAEADRLLALIDGAKGGES